MTFDVEITEPTFWSSEPSLGELLAAIKDDLRTHRRDWRAAGFRALAVYRVGSFRRTLRAGPFRKAMAPVCSALERRIGRRYGIELPSTATIGRSVRIEHQGAIVVHSRAVVGDRCLIRQGVTLGNGARHSFTDRPILGCDVRLGAGAVIIGRSRVGDGAHVGPNAVVQSDVPSAALVVAPKSRLLRLPVASSSDVESARSVD